MNETITIKEALKRIISDLEKISIPVKYCEQIGLPLSEAVVHLYDCMNACPEDDQEEKAEGGENNVQV